MPAQKGFEIGDYWAAAKRRKWVILIPVLLLPVVAVAISYTLAPRYESQTLVLIEDPKVPDNYVKPVISADLDSRLASMKEQILSRSRIQPIIERYNLFGNSRMSMDDRVEKARKDISIKPIHSEIAHSGGLPGFFIDFTASDAHTAQLICGEIVSLFVSENLRSREASAEGTTEFLKGQLSDAKRSLDEQDAKLATFQSKYGGKLPGEESSNLNMLTSLNTQLEAANQGLARMEQDKVYQTSLLTQQIQASGATSPSSSTAAVPSASSQAQEAELTNLLAEQAELTSKYTPEHPDLIAVTKRITDLRNKIAHPAATKTSGSPASARPESVGVQQLRAQIRASDIGIEAKRREQQQLQAAVRTYQDRISSSPMVQAEYKNITRDYETAQKFYDDLLGKMNQSKMATDLERRNQGEQFHVMDEPNLPDSPSFPKRAYFLFAGLAGGIVLGLGLAALLEHLDAVVRTERDLASSIQLPVLATIGYWGEPPPPPAEKPKSRFKGFPSRKLRLADPGTGSSHV